MNRFRVNEKWLKQEVEKILFSKQKLKTKCRNIYTIQYDDICFQKYYYILIRSVLMEYGDINKFAHMHSHYAHARMLYIYIYHMCAWHMWCACGMQIEILIKCNQQFSILDKCKLLNYSYYYDYNL